MPITFDIDSKTKTVRTRVTGPLFEADPIQYVADVLEHPAYIQGLAALVICERVELGRFSARTVRRLTNFTRQMEQSLLGTRVAIVASQAVVYGTARMYQLLRDPPYEVQVFRELAEAEAWLAEGVAR